ncbi:MAG: amidohydrolase [Rhodospirillales bacterium]|jgi:predicted TIM-barrel fold metal-dependent hydrolase|nr:amidohydrolase [Rhodospirillales bacterium]|tara:strand:+ start:16438 stop:17274 length:837 start_codon:yes stop_codon:yes gene_type:complete
MEFIDTHQHLIFRDRFGYEWTNGIPPLAEGDFTPSDYAALTEGKGIGGTVFMETGVDDADYQAEARHVAGMIGTERMLGQIASCRPEDELGFDAWLEECKDLGVVGYRRILHVMPDELSQSSTFRTNIKKIGAANLPFDICVLARQLPLATELARACEGQHFILNHCGVPDIAGGAFEVWATDIEQLAQLPHVTVKLSGLTAYCTPGTGNTETLQPWVNHVLDAFGPARMVWGGDWPIVNLGSGLPDWIAITRELLKELSSDEQSAIAGDNARKLFKL